MRKREDRVGPIEGLDRGDVDEADAVVEPVAMPYSGRRRALTVLPVAATPKNSPLCMPDTVACASRRLPSAAIGS
jgi:hypothetical protein